MIWELIKRTLFSDNFLDQKNSPMTNQTMDVLVITTLVSLRRPTSQNLREIINSYNQEFLNEREVTQEKIELLLKELKLDPESRKVSEMLSSSNLNYCSKNRSDSLKIIERIISSPFSMSLNLQKVISENSPNGRRKLMSEEDMIHRLNQDRVLEKKKFMDISIDFDFLSKRPKF